MPRGTPPSVHVEAMRRILLKRIYEGGLELKREGDRLVYVDPEKQRMDDKLERIAAAQFEQTRRVVSARAPKLANIDPLPWAPPHRSANVVDNRMLSERVQLMRQAILDRVRKEVKLGTKRGVR